MIKKITVILFMCWSWGNIAIAQPSSDDELMQTIMDPNVDLEEAIELMAKDFPELLNPVVDAKSDFEKAVKVQDAAATGEYYQNVGRKFLQEKNYTQAILFFKKSLKATEKKLGGIQRHPQFSSTYKDLGEALEGNEEVKEALKIYQRGLRSNAISFDDADLLSNPIADDLIAPLLSIPIFEAKGNALLESDNSSNQTLAAMIAYERGLEILEIVNSKYRTEYSKLHLGEQAISLTEKAINAARRMYQLTRDEKYLFKMFSLADQGKAMALQSAHLDAKASGFANVPTADLQREQATKIQLGLWKQKLKSQKERDLSTERAEKKIFQLEQSLYFLQDSLKTYFPEYKFLKSTSNSLAIDSLQFFLRENKSAIVEYFIGKKSAYAFVLTGKELFVERLEDLDLIEKNVLSIRELIQSLSFRIDAQTAYSSFIRDASNLYSLALEKPMQHVSTSIDEVIFIPDGALWLVPFEMMLYEKAASGEVNFGTENLPYLLKKHAITYAHSAKLLLNQKINNNTFTNIPFLGHAPKFEGDPDIALRSCFDDGVKLPELKHSLEEVKNINKNFQGQTFIGNQATRKSFLKNVSDAEIIHLSTHACMNSVDPLDSRIFFSQDDFINTEEIYNLRINAKMAMLSACQTGLGKVYNGEGMISLARAFQYAGCPSVTMSLWSVADASTSEITTLYYDYLDEGLSKSKALQKAKLDFIDNQSAAKQHPFFWAGFVHLGDFSPIKESGGGMNYLYLGIGILALLIIVKLF